MINQSLSVSLRVISKIQCLHAILCCVNKLVSCFCFYWNKIPIQILFKIIFYLPFRLIPSVCRILFRSEPGFFFQNSKCKQFGWLLDVRKDINVLNFVNFWMHQNFNYQVCMSKMTSHKTKLMNTSNISYQHFLYLKRQLFPKFCSNTCERHAETIRNCPLNWSGTSLIIW